jgi:hypothetical protein
MAIIHAQPWVKQLSFGGAEKSKLAIGIANNMESAEKGRNPLATLSTRLLLSGLLWAANRRQTAL